MVRHEDTEWGRITRVHPFPTDKRNIPARAAAFGGFTALSTALGVAGRRSARPDAVLAMSPPLTLGGAGWLAARPRGVPFVFNIQDVFPDVAVELGAISNPRVIQPRPGSSGAATGGPTPSPCCPTTCATTSSPRSGARCPTPTTASG